MEGDCASGVTDFVPDVHCESARFWLLPAVMIECEHGTRSGGRRDVIASPTPRPAAPASPQHQAGLSAVTTHGGGPGSRQGHVPSAEMTLRLRLWCMRAVPGRQEAWMSPLIPSDRVESTRRSQLRETGRRSRAQRARPARGPALGRKIENGDDSPSSSFFTGSRSHGRLQFVLSHFIAA